MSGKIKNLFALAMTAVMMASVFSGCTSSNSTSASAQAHKDVTLTLWGSQDDQAMLQQMADSFKSTHKDNNYTINLKVCGEDTASAEALKDLSAAGDVFAFKSEQIAQLHNAGALLKADADTDEIKTSNLPDSVAAATVNGILYAYPSSNDTYFLYYNKKYLNEKDVKTLDGIMNKQMSSDVANLAFNLSNGLYCSSFFLTAGCQLFGPNGTDSKKCTFNDVNGANVGNCLINLESQNPKFIDYDTNYDSSVIQNFKDRKIAACVSDLSNAAKIQQALGSDYAAAKLPAINFAGKDKQMVSFADYTLYGVNSHTKNPKAAMELAEFLTNKDNQKIRFEKRGLAPVNKALASDKTMISANPAVAADLTQIKYSKPQPSIIKMNDFWTPIGDFGLSIENGVNASTAMRKNLDTMVKTILSKKS